MYIIKDKETENTIEAYDLEGKLKGEAIICPFQAADIHETARMNIYFDIKVNEVEDKVNIKDQLFEEVMKRSRAIRENYKDMAVKVYHCCFSNDIENIEYYSKKEGFQNDEGMYIIKKVLTGQDLVSVPSLKDIEFCKLYFEDEQELRELVEEQCKVFIRGYSVNDLIQIKSDYHQWFSIAAKHDGKIVANLLMIIKKDETGLPYGWVDDLFVAKDWRGLGIAKNLILLAYKELIILGIHESRLEVWSDNKKALTLYESLGYKFYEQTESSIGMYI